MCLEVDDPAIEDVHHYVETRLVEIAGEVGYKLHTGRSRNEQIATDLRLYVREQIDAISQQLREFVGAFVNQAEAAGETAMPAYTHLQRAEPVLVAHWLLAYVEMFLRDIDRLGDCRKRLNVCPLGRAAVAGTILPLDREAIAAELGVRRADGEQHGCDQRSRFRDRVRAGAVVRGAAPQPLGGGAHSVLDDRVRLREAARAVLHRQQRDAAEEESGCAGADPGKAGKVYAEATALFITMKGLPLAYNKDMQETQQPVFAAARAGGEHVTGR